MFKEIHAPWLVRTSSLNFHKAPASHHTSALLKIMLAAYVIGTSASNSPDIL